MGDKVTGRRRRRRGKLLDDLKERRVYSHLKEEALESSLWKRLWTCRKTAALYPQERDPVPIVQEAGSAPRSAWTGVENISPTGIRSPERPARSESLYRLSRRGAIETIKRFKGINISYLYLINV
jgi:hypothetical protein